MPLDKSLRLEFLSMKQADLRLRQELAMDGSLYEEYHPRMEEMLAGRTPQSRTEDSGINTIQLITMRICS